MTDNAQDRWTAGENSMVYVNPAPDAAAPSMPSGKFGSFTIGYTPRFQASGLDKCIQALRDEHLRIANELTAERDRYKALWEGAQAKLDTIKAHCEHPAK